MDARGVTPKVWDEAPDLAALLDDPGPFLSLVLATEAQIDNAAQRNELRWRSARDRLEEDGADESVLAAVNPLVPEAHLQGQTLVVLATSEGVRHASHWPTLPFRELARWAPLPSFGAVLERRQESPPHVVVVADREGADISAVHWSGAEAEIEAGAVERVGRKVHPGGWSQRRYQERAENSWETNARDVADQVVRLVRRVDARLVVLAGDVRATQLVLDDLPDDVRSLVAAADGTRAEDGTPPSDPAELQRLLAEVAARETVSLVEKLAEEIGQKDRGRGGVKATIDALLLGQVQVLLVRDDPDDDRTLWFGDEPMVVGAGAGDLEGLTHGIRKGRLVDVLIRSALAGGAGVRMVDAGAGARVPEGVGAILRWA